MFSGDRNYPTQWALNPSAYQNMSNDQVDWAALAQQWIMMKETCPPEQVPPAPPPPSIGPVKKKSVSSSSGNSLIEAGEAPMEVENDKDDGDDEPPASWTGPATGPGSWNWEQQQWGWNSNWSGNATSSASSSVVPPTGAKTALLPTPFGFPDVSNTASYSGYASGLWSSDSTRSKSKQKHRESDDEQMNTTVALDAAKRRQLPAWIREGLEKMEREKQKQIDKEREAREREEFLKLKKQEAEEVRKVMTDSGLVVLPSKSKFESDSEESEKEDIVNEVQKIGTKRDDQETIMRSKSKEERLQDVMLQVRRMMTEILLDVTTTEIEIICQEELKRNRASASAMNLQKTPALASLTGKLGLGIYGESASSDSDSDHSNPDDSDSYLKETIRRRKAEFARTEREIDARAQEVERRQAEQDREVQPTKSSNQTKDVERYNQVEPTNSHGLLEHKTVPARKSRFHDAAEPHTVEIKKQTETKQISSSSSQSSESSSESSHRSYKPKRDRHRRDRDSRSVSSVRSIKESNGNNKRTRKGYSRSRSREYSRKRSVSREYYRSRSRSHRRSRSRSKHSYRRSRSRDQRRHRSRSRDYNRSSQRRSRSRERGKRSYRH